MNIAELLIKNFDPKIKTYFHQESLDKWRNSYQASLKNLDHDEPWLTLIACYAIFGEQSKINDPGPINAFNAILKDCGLKQDLTLDKIDSVQVEEKLPEIFPYRDKLRDLLSNDNFHLYPDRRKDIEEKIKADNASFEGNTNLDLKITGEQAAIKKHLFIEAKFLSDISYQTSYNPVRDQIIRNIDAGIDHMERLNNDAEVNYKDFYFLLLTPQIFRPKEFGTRKQSGIDVFCPERSRLYCYKMPEYKDYGNFRDALPHRADLKEEQWKDIADNIGWIVFEDFFQEAVNHRTFKESLEEQEILKLAAKRNLY